MSRCRANSPVCYARAHDPKQCSCPPLPKWKAPPLFVVFSGKEPKSFNDDERRALHIASLWTKGSVVEYRAHRKVER